MADLIYDDSDLLEDLIELAKKKDDKLIDAELEANDIIPPKSRKEKLRGIEEILREDNLVEYIPPRVLHTETFRTEVLDELLSVEIPTGLYRITMRKLLKLPFRELQDQARLLEISVVDKDEIQLAKEIISTIREDSPLNDLLKRRLLKNEMTFTFGVEIEMIKDQRYPSSITSVHVFPSDMVASEIMTRRDIENECKNQGLTTSRNDNPLKLALRLISHFQTSPDRVRLPLTENFEEFLLAKSEIR